MKRACLILLRPSGPSRWLGLLLGLMVTEVARAEGTPDGGTSSAPVLAAPEAGAPTADLLTPDGGSVDGPRRERADFRGQQDPPPTTGEVLIWIPRVILLPAYLVTEYALRVPVGGLSTTAEKNRWGNTLFDFFAFGPDHRGGIFPTFFIDFGVRPSVGLHFFWDDTFVRDNRFTADVAWGGSNWVTVAMGDRYRFNQADSLSVAARWNRRPDNLYYGIGPEVDVSKDARTRYGTDAISGSIDFEHVQGPLKVKAAARIDRTVFRDYSCCSDPTLNERVAAGQLPAPPGFQQNTTAASIPLSVVIDTRPSGPWHRSGVRAGVEVAPAVDVTRGFDRSWIRYGGMLQGFWDMTGTGRVLGLGVWADFVDPFGDQPVPFTNLVTLGGTEPFVGFIHGSLRDRSSLAAELSYNWPVFAHLEGVAGVSVGNVFDKHLRGFDVNLLRGSAELGIRTRDLGNSSFQFIVGVGTKPFREGFELKTFRFSFGVTYGL
ncbi:MAG TPA: hypothetical protein VLT82_04910 [Myxococcaceae bacterium]|nr:hypothetical protein [Myxococcaceae bacterium]